MMEQNENTIVVGATGASGMPVLLQCLSLIHQARRRAVLVLTKSAVLTLRQEVGGAPIFSVCGGRLCAGRNWRAASQRVLAIGRNACGAVQHEDRGGHS